MLIYKEELPVAAADLRPIKLPCRTVEEAVKRIFKLDVQYNLPCIWFQADAADGEALTEKVIHRLSTKHYIRCPNRQRIFYILRCIVLNEKFFVSYLQINPFVI